jgi:hypothetical protein
MRKSAHKSRSAEPDLASIPNDALEDQLAADIQLLKEIEHELAVRITADNFTLRWLRTLVSILEQNARSAKSQRVFPRGMSVERTRQCREKLLQHSRTHTDEAKLIVIWYFRNLKERRDQISPGMQQRVEAVELFAASGPIQTSRTKTT